MLTVFHHLAGVGQSYHLTMDYMEQQDLRGLAGESFSAPSISICMAAFFYNPFAPWWAPVGEGQQ